MEIVTAPDARPFHVRFRADLLCVVALLVVVALMWVPRLRGPIDLRYDAGVYYLLGTSLGEGAGYRIPSEPGAPEGIQYPPALPLLVAAHQKVLGTTDFVTVGRALRFTYLAMSLLLAPAIYLLARGLVTPTYALLAALVSTLYHNSVLMSDLLFTELPFSLATVLFFICWLLAERLRASPGAGSRPRAAAALGAVCGILGVVAYLMRSAGIALLAAWVGDAVMRRRWKQAGLRLAVMLLPVIAWQMHVSRVTHSDGYTRPAYEYQRASYQFYNVSYINNLQLVDPFEPDRGRIDAAGWAARLGRNLVAMPAALGESVSTPGGFWNWMLNTGLRKTGIDRPTTTESPAVKVALAALGVLVLAGCVLLAKRGLWLIPLYVAASVAVICLTPWPGQFARYLTPVGPLVAVAFVVFLAWLANAVRGESNRRRLLVAIGGVLLFAPIFAVQGFALLRAFGARLNDVRYASPANAPVAYRLFYYDPKWADFDAAIDWLRGHAPEGSVVATSSPHWTHLRTGLRAVMPPFLIDTAEAQRLMDTVPTRYLIVDALDFVNVSKRYAGPAVEAHPTLWREVYRSRDASLKIYERTGQSPNVSPPDGR